MENSMIHWNGDQMVAIDTETTGLDPHYHEIIQIGMLALNSNLEPRQDIMPFNILIKPESPQRVDPEALVVNKIQMNKVLTTGFTLDTAITLMEDWIEKLNLSFTKAGNHRCWIIPLGHNFAFDQAFLGSMLGIQQYNEWFTYRYCDTQIAARFLNDRAAMHGNQVPYSKTALSWLAKQHDVEAGKAHDALGDCITTAGVWRAMCLSGLLA